LKVAQRAERLVASMAAERAEKKAVSMVAL